MKVYVASAFMNYQEVRWFCETLRAVGHEITYDWTITDEFDENGKLRYSSNINGSPYYAKLDVEGVRDAEVLVLLSQENMNGALWEAGMAIGFGRQVIVVAPHRNCIFHHLPNVQVVDNKADVLHLLNSMHADQSQEDGSAQEGVRA